MNSKNYMKKRRQLLKELTLMQRHREIVNKDIVRIRASLRGLDNALVNGDINE